MRSTVSALLLASILHGCGGPAAPPDAALPDAGADVSTDISHDAPVDAPLDVPSDAPADAPVDAPVDAPPVDAGVPVRCAAGTACDGLLDGDGLCRARCVAAEYSLRCHGEVRSGICYAAPPPSTNTYDRDGWERAAVTLPAEAEVGVPQTVVFSLRNTSDAARPLSWRVSALGAWAIESEDPPSGSTRELAAGAAVQVTLRMRPTVANALDPTRQVAASVAIDGVDTRGGWPLFIPVRYPSGEGARCGERWFPGSLAGDEVRYGEAACCGGVFFPGAQCCTSSDCPDGGVCGDGRCLSGPSAVPFSATPLAGPQRVLVVLVDSSHAPAADPCADRSAELREELGLDAIERWYERTAVARIGRPSVSWRWTVLAGLRGADLGLPSGSVPPAVLHRQAESWLRGRGCLRGFDQDYDRTMVYSPSVDLGPYGGMVFRTHRIAQNSLGSSLFAHELGHTFGATDRYLDLGGSTHWAGTLMSNANNVLLESARDDVFWAEVGLGDADSDGVIDLHQAAIAPEALRIGTLRVTAFTDSRSLSYSLSFEATQGGRSLRSLPQEATLSLPGTSARVALDRWDALGGGNRGTWIGYLFSPRDVSAEVFDTIVRDGRVRVRVEAGLHSTRADFSRASLSLDETREVTLTPPRSARLQLRREAARPGYGSCGH